MWEATIRLVNNYTPLCGPNLVKNKALREKGYAKFVLPSGGWLANVPEWGVVQDVSLALWPYCWSVPLYRWKWWHPSKSQGLLGCYGLGWITRNQPSEGIWKSRLVHLKSVQAVQWAEKMGGARPRAVLGFLWSCRPWVGVATWLTST